MNTKPEEIGMVLLPRLLTVKQFCGITQLCESAIRHNLDAYRHLMVKLPARKVRFDAAKVYRAIQNGTLRKAA